MHLVGMHFIMFHDIAVVCALPRRAMRQTSIKENDTVTNQQKTSSPVLSLACGSSPHTGLGQGLQATTDEAVSASQ